MTATDPDELAVLMGLLADDVAMVVPFVEVHGDRLAGVVRHHLRQLNRRDLAADHDEVQGLVWDVALFLQKHAGAWQPGHALPWNWAKRGIAKLIADAIGHARADVDVDVLDLTPDRPWAAETTEVGLEDLGADPVVDLLREALDAIGCSDRDREVHIEYRRQSGDGDRSPAHTVAAMFSLTPANVRQIDRRVRTKLQALAAADERFAPLADLPWLTGQRVVAGAAPGDALRAGGMSPNERPSMWSVDRTKLCERLAERLRAEGARHPGDAAVALAVRGARREDRQHFALRLGVAEQLVADVECGRVPASAWPATLVALAASDGLGEPPRHS